MTINQLVRDLTAKHPLSKSEARRLLLEYQEGIAKRVEDLKNSFPYDGYDMAVADAVSLIRSTEAHD